MNKLTLSVLTVLAIVLTACGAPGTEPAPIDTMATTASSGNEPTAIDSNTQPVPTEAATLAPTEAAMPAGVSFSKDVLPILQSRCSSCHSGEQARKGLSVISYETLMAGSTDGAVIIPGDANGSLLIQLVSSGQMPQRGPKLTPEQIQMIIDWILAGALNN